MLIPFVRFLLCLFLLFSLKPVNGLLMVKGGRNITNEDPYFTYYNYNLESQAFIKINFTTPAPGTPPLSQCQIVELPQANSSLILLVNMAEAKAAGCPVFDSVGYLARDILRQTNAELIICSDLTNGTSPYNYLFFLPYDLDAPITLIQGVDFNYLLSLPPGSTLSATAQESIFQIYYLGNSFLAFRIFWILVYIGVQLTIWAIFLLAAVKKHRRDRSFDWFHARSAIVLLSLGMVICRIICFCITGAESSLFLTVLFDVAYVCAILIFVSFLHLWINVVGAVITSWYHVLFTKTGRGVVIYGTIAPIASIGLNLPYFVVGDWAIPYKIDQALIISSTFLVFIFLIASIRETLKILKNPLSSTHDVSVVRRFNYMQWAVFIEILLFAVCLGVENLLEDLSGVIVGDTLIELCLFGSQIVAIVIVVFSANVSAHPSNESKSGQIDSKWKPSNKNSNEDLEIPQSNLEKFVEQLVVEEKKNEA